MAIEPQSSYTEQELKRLLEPLKNVPEEKRTPKQRMELEKLQVIEKNMKKPALTVLSIQGPGSIAFMSQDYERKFAKTPGYTNPAPKSATMTLTFQSATEAGLFLQSQAAKGRKFRVLDAQHNPIATSNGKGVIQMEGGRPFNPVTFLAAAAIKDRLNMNQQTLLQQSPQVRAAVMQNPNMQKFQQRLPGLMPAMTAPRSTTTLNAQVKISPLQKISTPLSMKPVPEALKESEKSTTPSPFKRKITPFDQSF